MNEVNITLLSCMLFMIIISVWFYRSQQRMIDRQNDTIQRLLNREPVTYAEVGEKPPKRNTECYVAWGNQTMDMEEIEE